MARRMNEPAVRAVLLKYRTIYVMLGRKGLPDLGVKANGESGLWEIRFREFRDRPDNELCFCEVCKFIEEEAEHVVLDGGEEGVVCV